MESRIADAICKNNQLLKAGLRFEFPEVRDRVSAHLIKNIDRLRKERVKTDGVTEKKEWKPARVLDQLDEGDGQGKEEEEQDQIGIGEE